MTSAPSRWTVPDDGSRWRARTASSVDLPEPFGPVTASRAPGSIVRSSGPRSVRSPVHDAVSADALDAGRSSVERSGRRWSGRRCRRRCRRRGRDWPGAGHGTAATAGSRASRPRTRSALPVARARARIASTRGVIASVTATGVSTSRALTGVLTSRSRATRATATTAAPTARRNPPEVSARPVLSRRVARSSPAWASSSQPRAVVHPPTARSSLGLARGQLTDPGHLGPRDEQLAQPAGLERRGRPGTGWPRRARGRAGRPRPPGPGPRSRR